MQRIVIDARELRTSSGRYVERLLHYLQQIDNDHAYKVLLKPKDMSGWKPSNPNFEAAECPHKEFSIAEQNGLLEQIDKLEADLVHFPFPQQPIRYKGKVVTTIHDLTTLRFNNPDKNPIIFKLKQKIYARVIKKAARKSVAVMTASQFVKDDIIQFTGIDPAKVTVTPEAADPILEAAIGLPNLESKQFIMYIGRPTPHKNLERLIEAFALLKAKNPGLLLVLAGKKDANYRRIEDMVGQKDIIFTDFVGEGQLRWLYENCAAYVFPSLSEGFGLPGLEAMIHGAPVVSSNATCLPEIYGEAAHYFDPLDVDAMVTAINEVLTDKKLRDDLISKGEAQAAKYSWQRMAEQTLNVYNRVLN
ncbi:MAG TPA: glycosyltransferase family 1 protein [Methylomirabilota bacterium]|nr:glycosyltransferase family 1 protein [Methylomirabilota bacterium]